MTFATDSGEEIRDHLQKFALSLVEAAGVAIVGEYLYYLVKLLVFITLHIPEKERGKVTSGSRSSAKEVAICDASSVDILSSYILRVTLLGDRVTV